MSAKENVLFNIYPEMTPKIDESGVAFSLRSRDYKQPQAIVYENHSQDTRYKELGEVCQTVSATWGGRWKQPTIRSQTSLRRQQKTQLRRIYGCLRNSTVILRDRGWKYANGNRRNSCEKTYTA